VTNALAIGLMLAPSVPSLVGFASLPADTFIEGPTSGQLLNAVNGRTPPFELRQPVGSISAVLVAPGNHVMALTDNGFGRKERSADHVLSFHSFRLDFADRRVRIERSFHLSDPYRKIAWPIVADMETYPDSPYPVDATIKEQRLLTGWDFDPESFRQSKDGTFWFGDEYGPFLLSTDVAGRILRAPIPFPGLRAPENPTRRIDPNLGSSQGVEGLAIDRNRRKLYAIMQGPLTSARDRSSVLLYEFDTQTRTFSNRSWTYRLDNASNSVSDMVLVDGLRFLVVERDDEESLRARFKRVFLFDAAKGTKRLVADLLNVDDRLDVNKDGLHTYTMPFADVGAVAIKDSQTILVANDNRYPFGSARFPSVPDNTEFALIKLPKPLSQY
jgi:hypothetical protein